MDLTTWAIILAVIVALGAAAYFFVTSTFTTPKKVE